MEEEKNAGTSHDISYTQNREISWLRFNRRVLEEADEEMLPLLERLKFAAIFARNLDEFFMIRVGSIQDLALMDENHTDNKSGWTAQEQLKRIYRAVTPLYGQKDRIFFQLQQKLSTAGISREIFTQLSGQEKKTVQEYFESFVLPVLSPQVVDERHPFPHLSNKTLYVALLLKTKNGGQFGIVPVPRAVPRLFFLEGEGIRYLLLEDIISAFADTMFGGFGVAEKTVVSVTRNADINPDDEAFDVEDDFRLRMKKVLKKRARLAPVRLETQGEPVQALEEYLCGKLGLAKKQVYHSASPLDLSYVFQLEEKLPQADKRELLHRPYTPRYSPMLRESESVLPQVLRRDVLLYYPYESMDPFLRLVREAALDPSVLSIRITLYRIDRKSKLAEYLVAAAEAQKDVTVLMELRARFDEQNNIEWAERLEEAGCKVIFGIDGFKVHSKLCLITLRDKGRIRCVTQAGTGNYNEKTAGLYSDLSLITANEEIGKDAAAFFKNLSVSRMDGRYSKLVAAPSMLKETVLTLIDHEIEKKENGLPAGISFKLNSITDRDVIDRLSMASRAGVPVALIVRGICCILPGVPGKTENVTVRSIVGRFLEHARVYCFGGGDDRRIYISSADLMTRNTERRVEIACPILDEELKRRILHILDVQLRDTVKGRRMLPDGTYQRIPSGEDGPLDSQEYFMHETANIPAPAAKEPEGGFLASLLRHIAKHGTAAD
ncbi:polyphosphate kinase 1 [Papillibacter cinnamivorans]|uniref:polyphosphate kinase 1 n=1 Tax=Papillibacter cinnamivorans TaxID=100176 RepID=UPI001FA85697|nr:polyphosphate kinase 1 [Papillibacter cinnamivorans]